MKQFAGERSDTAKNSNADQEESAIGDYDDDWEARDINTALRQLNIIPPASEEAIIKDNHIEPGPNGKQSAMDAGMLISEPIDSVLASCLENQRERLTLLKFEDQIVRFIKNPRETQLTFPPLSSYHRLIIHRLADRCRLEHQTAEYPSYPMSTHDGMRVVTLFKAADSSIPTLLLIDLSCERQAEKQMTLAETPKIMIRKRGDAKALNDYFAGANGREARNARTIQDREKAYAEARARIFGDESSIVTTEVSSSSSVEEVTQKGSKVHRQALGPDGSNGFERGRGRHLPKSSMQSLVQVSEGQRMSSLCNEARNVQGGRGHGRARDISQIRLDTAQNWKESRVLWRNREEEMNDPDFTRHHDTVVRSGYTRYANEGPTYTGSGAQFMPSTSHSRTQAQYGEPGHDQHYGYQGHSSYSHGQRTQLDEYSRSDYMQEMFAASEYAQRSWRHAHNDFEGNAYASSSAGQRSAYGTEKRQTNVPLTEEAYNEEFPPLGK